MYNSYILQEYKKLQSMPAYLEDVLLGQVTPSLGDEDGLVAPPDEVVVSGMSGRLPESETVEEFRQHLIQGDDMVTDDDRRWPPGIYVHILIYSREII